GVRMALGAERRDVARPNARRWRAVSVDWACGRADGELPACEMDSERSVPSAGDGPDGDFGRSGCAECGGSSGLFRASTPSGAARSNGGFAARIKTQTRNAEC